jgi:hypothetical protein
MFRIDCFGAREFCPACRTGRRSHFRQTEIENLGMAAAGNENIGWLDVPMDDALGVRRFQRLGNLDGQRQQRFRSQWTPAEGVLKRCAIQKLVTSSCLCK